MFHIQVIAFVSTSWLDPNWLRRGEEMTDGWGMLRTVVGISGGGVYRAVWDTEETAGTWWALVILPWSAGEQKEFSLIIIPIFSSLLAKLLLFLPANLAPFLWLFLGIVTTSSCSSCGIDATFCRKIFSSVCAIRTISSVGYRKHKQKVQMLRREVKPFSLGNT